MAINHLILYYIVLTSPLRKEQDGIELHVSWCVSVLLCPLNWYTFQTALGMAVLAPPTIT